LAGWWIGQSIVAVAVDMVSSLIPRSLKPNWQNPARTLVAALGQFEIHFSHCGVA
jgi:hypothetical protein